MIEVVRTSDQVVLINEDSDELFIDSIFLSKNPMLAHKIICDITQQDTWFKERSITIYNEVARIKKSIPLDVDVNYVTLTVALFHNYLENKVLSIRSLEVLVGRHVCGIIKVLTRREDEMYTDYIERVKNDKCAKIVKYYIILHNLRTCNPSMVSRYARALVVLSK